MNAFEVLQPGAFTTVQDLGRTGYQKYGVSISGAMDRFALRVANLLAGNEEGEAALEATVVGPRLRALRNLIIAFTGADLSPQVNGKPVRMWSALEIAEGERISFGSPRNGCRAYLSVRGGIDFPVVMGSRSVHTRSNLGGQGRALIKGDVLGVRETASSTRGLTLPFLPAEQVPAYGKSWEVRVVFGPQNDYFTRKGIETFLGGEYTITPQSDRMGYRLKGAKIEHRAGPDILTDATPPGSVQVPGDGMPIVLLADGQTTGGYSKIAVVTSVDQDLLAQAKPGDEVRFRRITILEAQGLIWDTEKKILEMKKRIRF